MFYLILAIILILVYMFIPIKNIKSTMNLIVLMVGVAFLIIFGLMSVIHLIQSPPEIFVGLALSVLGVWALKDMFQLSSKAKPKTLEKISINKLIQKVNRS